MPKTAVKPKFVARQHRELLLHGTEIGIFLACLGVVNELRTLERDFDEGAISKAAFLGRSNVLLALFTEAAEATERFDVLLPVVEYGQFSPCFWRWFNWWEDYFRAMSRRQMGQLERRARNGSAAVADHRPAGDWLGYRQAPAFTVVTA
jgi:hypothetical protein